MDQQKSLQVTCYFEAKIEDAKHPGMILTEHKELLTSSNDGREEDTEDESFLYYHEDSCGRTVRVLQQYIKDSTW